MLEATGHYHRIVVAYLTNIGAKHFIINPLLSKRAKSAQLRKVKNRCSGRLASRRNVLSRRCRAASELG
nr:transposase [Cohnella lupini]